MRSPARRERAAHARVRPSAQRPCRSAHVSYSRCQTAQFLRSRRVVATGFGL